MSSFTTTSAAATLLHTRITKPRNNRYRGLVIRASSRGELEKSCDDIFDDDARDWGGCYSSWTSGSGVGDAIVYKDLKNAVSLVKEINRKDNVKTAKELVDNMNELDYFHQDAKGV